MPFKNIKEYQDAMREGRTVTGHFRKTPGNASVAGWWTDLGMAAGMPGPNYYASVPLKAAVLNAVGGLDGIFHGGPKSPKEQYLAEMMVCSPSAGMVGNHRLMDYVMYYPFIDGDDTDAQVVFNNSDDPLLPALPRYTTGGLNAYLVAQAPTVGGGSYTINYLDQAGVLKTSPVNYCSTTGAVMGAFVSAPQAAGDGGRNLHIILDGIDTITKLISFRNIVPNGGLVALVLAAPLAQITLSEINTPVEMSFINQRPAPPRIYDDAYLAFMSNTVASVAAGILTGRLNFVWTA
jgi:hypothetical protein